MASSTCGSRGARTSTSEVDTAAIELSSSEVDRKNRYGKDKTPKGRQIKNTYGVNRGYCEFLVPDPFRIG